MTKFKIYIESPENSGDRIRLMRDQSKALVISLERMFECELNDNTDQWMIKHMDPTDIESMNKILTGEINADPNAWRWIKCIVNTLSYYNEYHHEYANTNECNIIYPETFLHPDWISILIRYLIQTSMKLKININIITNSAHVMESIQNEMIHMKVGTDYVYDEDHDFRIETYIDGKKVIYDNRLGIIDE